MTSVSYPQSGSESDNIKLADPDTDLALSLAVTQQLIKIFSHTVSYKEKFKVSQWMRIRIRIANMSPDPAGSGKA